MRLKFTDERLANADLSEIGDARDLARFITNRFDLRARRPFSVSAMRGDERVLSSAEEDWTASSGLVHVLSPSQTEGTSWIHRFIQQLR
jgi:hypothetical protein